MLKKLKNAIRAIKTTDDAKTVTNLRATAARDDAWAARLDDRGAADWVECEAWKEVESARVANQTARTEVREILEKMLEKYS